MDADGRIKGKKSSKGIALVYVALTLVVVVVFVGLVVEIGYMYVTKGQLQNAADAAALAGARLLGDPDDPGNQQPARDEAVKFALTNEAAGEAVVIVDGNVNTLSDPVLDGGNDITVGNWDPCRPAGQEAYIAGAVPVNAVQVRTRRTVTDAPASPQGQVSLFGFGRIIGWGKMSARAEAIAVLPEKAVGIAVCVKTCPLTGVNNLILQKDPKSKPIENGMAWTAFSCTQAPNVGKNGDVVDFIWGRLPVPSPMCGQCLTTNNAVGEALKELEDAFEDPTFDAAHKTISAGKVTSWTVVVVVTNATCGTCSGSPVFENTSGCPPGGQGSAEPYNISRLARMTITRVNRGGAEQGVTINNIECMPCSTACATPIIVGNSTFLVK